MLIRDGKGCGRKTNFFAHSSCPWVLRRFTSIHDDDVMNVITSYSTSDNALSLATFWNRTKVKKLPFSPEISTIFNLLYFLTWTYKFVKFIKLLFFLLPRIPHESSAQRQEFISYNSHIAMFCLLHILHFLCQWNEHSRFLMLSEVQIPNRDM